MALVGAMELGDKTQLASIALAAWSGAPFSVFMGGAAAFLVLTTLAVVAGDLISRALPTKVVNCVAAFLFMIVGIWILLRG